MKVYSHPLEIPHVTVPDPIPKQQNQNTLFSGSATRPAAQRFLTSRHKLGKSLPQNVHLTTHFLDNTTPYLALKSQPGAGKSPCPPLPLTNSPRCPPPHQRKTPPTINSTPKITTSSTPGTPPQLATRAQRTHIPAQRAGAIPAPQN
jgi:hypothetical protein